MSGGMGKNKARMHMGQPKSGQWGTVTKPEGKVQGPREPECRMENLDKESGGGGQWKGLRLWGWGVSVCTRALGCPRVGEGRQGLQGAWEGRGLPGEKAVGESEREMA